MAVLHDGLERLPVELAAQISEYILHDHIGNRWLPELKPRGWLWKPETLLQYVRHLNITGNVAILSKASPKEQKTGFYFTNANAEILINRLPINSLLSFCWRSIYRPSSLRALFERQSNLNSLSLTLKSSRDDYTTVKLGCPRIQTLQLYQIDTEREIEIAGVLIESAEAITETLLLHFTEKLCTKVLKKGSKAHETLKKRIYGALAKHQPESLYLEAANLQGFPESTISQRLKKLTLRNCSGIKSLNFSALSLALEYLYILASGDQKDGAAELLGCIPPGLKSFILLLQYDSVYPDPDPEEVGDDHNLGLQPDLVQRHHTTLRNFAFIRSYYSDHQLEEGKRNCYYYGPDPHLFQTVRPVELLYPITIEIRDMEFDGEEETFYGRLRPDLDISPSAFTTIRKLYLIPDVKSEMDHLAEIQRHYASWAYLGELTDLLYYAVKGIESKPALEYLIFGITGKNVLCFKIHWYIHPTDVKRPVWVPSLVQIDIEKDAGYLGEKFELYDASFLPMFERDSIYRYLWEPEYSS